MGFFSQVGVPELVVEGSGHSGGPRIHQGTTKGSAGPPPSKRKLTFGVCSHRNRKRSERKTSDFRDFLHQCYTANVISETFRVEKTRRYPTLPVLSYSRGSNSRGTAPPPGHCTLATIMVAYPGGIWWQVNLRWAKRAKNFRFYYPLRHQLYFSKFSEGKVQRKKIVIFDKFRNSFC